METISRWIYPWGRENILLRIGTINLEWLGMLLISSSYHKTKKEILTEINQVQKAQKNPHHFGPLYNKYYDSIFMYVFKRLDNEHATAEITANVFFKCLQNIGMFKFQGVPFSAWLYKIAINEINHFFRKTKFNQSVFLK